MNYTYDELFLLCIDKEYHNTTTLSKALNVSCDKLYTYLLNNHPTLMKEVNTTLFMDHEWWDDVYHLAEGEIIVKVSEGGQGVYITPKGIPLYLATKKYLGVTYSAYKKLKLTTVNRKSTPTPIVKIKTKEGKTTFTSLGKMVAEAFMSNYDENSNVYKVNPYGAFNIENLQQKTLV